MWMDYIPQDWWNANRIGQRHCVIWHNDSAFLSQIWRMKICHQMKMIKAVVIVVTAVVNLSRDACSAFIWLPVVWTAKIWKRSIMMEIHLIFQVSYRDIAKLIYYLIYFMNGSLWKVIKSSKPVRMTLLFIMPEVHTHLCNLFSLLAEVSHLTFFI